MIEKVKERTEINRFFIIVIGIFLFIGSYTWFESVKQQEYTKGYEHGAQAAQTLFYHDTYLIELNSKIEFSKGYDEGYDKGYKDCSEKPDKEAVATSNSNISDINGNSFRWNTLEPEPDFWLYRHDF